MEDIWFDSVICIPNRANLTLCFYFFFLYYEQVKCLVKTVRWNAYRNCTRLVSHSQFLVKTIKIGVCAWTMSFPYYAFLHFHNKYSCLNEEFTRMSSISLAAANFILLYFTKICDCRVWYVLLYTYIQTERM